MNDWTICKTISVNFQAEKEEQAALQAQASKPELEAPVVTAAVTDTWVDSAVAAGDAPEVTIPAAYTAPTEDWSTEAENWNEGEWGGPTQWNG